MTHVWFAYPRTMQLERRRLVADDGQKITTIYRGKEVRDARHAAHHAVFESESAALKFLKEHAARHVREHRRQIGLWMKLARDLASQDVTYPEGELEFNE